MLRRARKQGIADTGELSNPLDAPTTEIIAEIWHIFGAEYAGFLPGIPRQIFLKTNRYFSLATNTTPVVIVSLYAENCGLGMFSAPLSSAPQPTFGP